MRSLSVLVVVFVATAASASPATSHDWYAGLFRSPNGGPCCNARDCRPVAHRVNRATGRERSRRTGRRTQSSTTRYCRSLPPGWRLSRLLEQHRGKAQISLHHAPAWHSSSPQRIVSLMTPNRAFLRPGLPAHRPSATRERVRHAALRAHPRHLQRRFVRRPRVSIPRPKSVEAPPLEVLAAGALEARWCEQMDQRLKEESQWTGGPPGTSVAMPCFTRLRFSNPTNRRKQELVELRPVLSDCVAGQGSM